jgi:hypothetical protein
MTNAGYADTTSRGGGWIIFAGVVLAVAGIMRIFDAIWAFSYSGPLPQNFQDALFGHSLDTYGWIYLIVGILLIATSFLVLNGSQVGRWVGIAAGAIATISAVWWIPYYPVWALAYIFLGILVIYALAAYGGEPESA